MKWDQRAADLINPVNEEKTKEAETELEITNSSFLPPKPAGQRASVWERPAGFHPNNSFTFYISLLQDCDSAVTSDLFIREKLHKLVDLRGPLF